jgi:hypothetical protein
MIGKRGNGHRHRRGHQRQPRLQADVVLVINDTDGDSLFFIDDSMADGSVDKRVAAGTGTKVTRTASANTPATARLPGLQRSAGRRQRQRSDATLPRGNGRIGPTIGRGFGPARLFPAPKTQTRGTP